jgi:hypothetical protein
MQATRINTKLAAYGNFLLVAQPSPAGPFAANGTGSSSVPVPAGQGGLVQAVGGSGAGSDWSLLLGAYGAVGTGSFSSAVLVQNQDWQYPVVATLTLAAAAAAGGAGSLGLGAGASSGCWEVDPVTGVPSPAVDDAPGLAGGGLHVSIDPGDARLFVFQS